MCHAPTITERCQTMDHAACAHVYFHVSLKLLTSSIYFSLYDNVFAYLHKTYTMEFYLYLRGRDSMEQ